MNRSWRLGASAFAILLTFGVLVPGRLAAQGTILPDQIGAFTKSDAGSKGKLGTVSVPDPALYDEYGLEATEQAEYKSPEKHFTATVWRLKDSTGGLALYQVLRPAASKPSDLAKLAARTPDGIVLANGNYVFQFTGAAPESADLEQLYSRLPKLDQSPLPALISYLPQDGLVPNSERYLGGPVALQRFEPRIPPSVAAFHLESEGQLGKYKAGKDFLTLAVFSFPTPNMARDQAEEYRKIPGAVVKRTGPLVAVTVAPPDVDAAERVLGQVRYAASVTVNEKVPVNEIKGMAKLLLDIFTLSGVLIVFSVFAGVGFGGFRLLARKISGREPPDAMIVLGLHDK